MHGAAQRPRHIGGIGEDAGSARYRTRDPQQFSDSLLVQVRTPEVRRQATR